MPKISSQNITLFRSIFTCFLVRLPDEVLSTPMDYNPSNIFILGFEKITGMYLGAIHITKGFYDQTYKGM